jgi:arabinogalactan endo-1,4-beta-galactosidase
MQVVETDYPAVCTGKYNPIPMSSEPSIPYNIEGQSIWVDGIVEIVKQVPDGLGQGVHYWEPTWLNNTSLGSDCEDAILFTPDYSNYHKMVGYSRRSVNMFEGRR